MNSFKRFNEEKLSDRKHFYISTKNKKIFDDGKKSDGHISFEDYLTCGKIWDKVGIKNKGGYHDHFFKNIYCY